MSDGILIIDKPENWTSHDVVARLRRILKTKRIGHTGTLDPFATGVLVMLVGRATRLAQFLDKDKKEYEATIRFGFETETGDRTGAAKEIQSERFEIQDEQLKETLKDFLGEIEQTPPMYSAKKVAGKKLYELARKGVEIERKPVKVTVYEIGETENGTLETKNENTLDVKIRVVCSAGTYIRTLAEDIGRKLKIGAHLSALRRTRAGIFDLSKAVSPEDLEKIVAAEKISDVLISMNDALAHLPQVVLSEIEIKDAQNGKTLRFETDEIPENQAIKMIDEAGNLIAVGSYLPERKSIQPRIVFV